jgi:hypothetical protein
MNIPAFQSPAFFDDPYQYYEALREGGPVVAAAPFAARRRCAVVRTSGDGAGGRMSAVAATRSACLRLCGLSGLPPRFPAQC